MTPTRVPNLTSVTHVSVGANHDCALRSTGRVWCWGSNVDGELGDGTTMTRLVPGRVVHLTRVVQVSANGFGSFTCARRSDGTVWCWGSNDYGLGDGTPATSRLAPVAVKGLPGPATDVSVGSVHACVRLEDRSVWCWGGNGAGGLGDGTRRNRLAATKSLMANARAVTAGAAGHTCATTRAHRARCWGYNASGQLGDGTTMNRTAPVAVVGLSGVRSVDAGDDHTCAVLTDHTIRCWGQNGNGQLGDGTTVPRSVPGPVLG
jgi:alpha-tubulin suppressor-like RCC1 family protein